MAAPIPGAILGAVRARLAGDADLQAYVGVDGTAADPSAARVIVKFAIDVIPATYPAITIYQERARLDPTMPRTWNPGFVLVQACVNQRDQKECLEMYEVFSRLLHGQRWTLGSETLGVCVKEVVERDVRGPTWVEDHSIWRLDALYRIRAAVIDP